MVRIRNYLSLVVFAHTVFAMPFALIGYFLAIRYSGFAFRWTDLILVIACMVLARNAAMGFNRWADRHIDAKNPRTAGREIPRGVISGRSALLFSLANALLFMGAAGLLNPLCLWLSPIALAIVLGYSYTKRFTWLCHLILGLGLALAPIGAYIGVTGQMHWLPWLFSGVVITWVGGFDIIYSLQDEEFDKTNQLKSIPARIGIKKALIISALHHLVTPVLLILAGILADFGMLYWIGSVLFTGLLIYQHRLVSPGHLNRINRAFGTTNGIASLILAAFVLAELFTR